MPLAVLVLVHWMRAFLEPCAVLTMVGTVMPLTFGMSLFVPVVIGVNADALLGVCVYGGYGRCADNMCIHPRIFA